MFTETINGVRLKFESDDSLFSPHSVDKGTLAMLSAVELSQSDKVLDLGCGYGVVGIYAAKLIGEDKVVMSDVDEECISLSKKNAVLNGVSGAKIIHSDGFRNMKESNFTLILSNPPYHTDFSVAKHFVEKGFNRLQIGGKIVMVTKRRDWYKNKLTAVFGGVKIIEQDGYFVFISEKRDVRYALGKPNANQKRSLMR
ncbi:MAG: class I SAM-dependent methyltransferase [Oscillospiraceae bacterium]|nr:class I SAM-dependent methyltransferase [Oscillospiraceae bacterium]